MILKRFTQFLPIFTKFFFAFCFYENSFWTKVFYVPVVFAFGCFPIFLLQLNPLWNFGQFRAYKNVQECKSQISFRLSKYKTLKIWVNKLNIKCGSAKRMQKKILNSWKRYFKKQNLQIVFIFVIKFYVQMSCDWLMPEPF